VPFTEWSAKQQPWVRIALAVAGYAIVYLAADVALNRFAFSDAWTIVWPLNGVNVAVLLMRPRRAWPWMILGIELGTGLGECLDDNSVGMELGQRVCSAAEILLSALVLPPFVTLERWLRTPHLFARFAAALALGPGTSGLGAAALFHVANGQPLLLAFNNWATADALGIASTMPLALALRSPDLRNLFRRTALPTTLGVLLLAFAGAGLIFSVTRYPLLFLLFPLLLLVDSLLSFAGSAIAVMGVLLISMYLTTHAYGPFGVWADDLDLPRDLALQIYFGFHLLALFPASIMFMERRRLVVELHETNSRLTVLASLDGLTGIANRRSFDERLAAEWNRASRHHEPIALAMIDLDCFKQFNDLYGHVAGDRCLVAVAEALSHQVHRPEDLVARFGGEEFAMLLPHTGPDGARHLLEQVRTRVHALAIDHIGNPWNRVTVSIGYAALIPSASDGQSRLIKLADAALYLAKSGGRNRVETLPSIEGASASPEQGTTSKRRIVRILSGTDP